MRAIVAVAALFGAPTCCVRGALSPESEVVKQHIVATANQTFRPPQGYLKYPYLVPSGPYNQCWDWDSMFMGVAMLDCCGSAPYLAGSMKNFFVNTNLTTGNVGGCVTPQGNTGTIYHAKPVLIQGAWLAAVKQDDFKQFEEFEKAMVALLDYWDTRKDVKTGLYVWHDQLETGADNLVLSLCPSARSDCWEEKQDAFTLASADVMTFLAREHVAYQRFVDKLGWLPRHGHGARKADSIKEALNKWLWRKDLGMFQAFNTSSRRPITNRVFVMGVPLFENLANSSQAATLSVSLAESDMLSAFGVRSTSSKDPRYNNVDEIKPYSNWRGPVWVNANAMLAYGLRDAGFLVQANDIGTRLVKTLANDLNQTGTWHEAYSAETGLGLAAPGFMSWNTLGGDLEENLVKGRNPFAL